MWFKKFFIVILMVCFSNSVVAGGDDPKLGIPLTYDRISNLALLSNLSDTFRKEMYALSGFSENFYNLPNVYPQPSGYFLKSSAFSLSYCSEYPNTELSVLYVVINKKSYGFAVFGYNQKNSTGIKECKNMADSYTALFRQAQENRQIIGFYWRAWTAKDMLYVPQNVYPVVQNKNLFPAE